MPKKRVCVRVGREKEDKRNHGFSGMLVTSRPTSFILRWRTAFTTFLPDWETASPDWRGPHLLSEWKGA